MRKTHFLALNKIKGVNSPESNHVRRMFESAARLRLHHSQELTATSEHFHLCKNSGGENNSKIYLVFECGGNNNTFVLKQANSNGSMYTLRHMLPQFGCTETHCYCRNCGASCWPVQNWIPFLNFFPISIPAWQHNRQIHSWKRRGGSDTGSRGELGQSCLCFDKSTWLKKI